MTSENPRGSGPPEASSRLFVVDRREGSLLVMVDDDDRSVNVEATIVSKACRREGAVLRVPTAPDGAPEWARAKPDRLEERRRIAELAARVKRLRRSDPGGDIAL